MRIDDAVPARVGEVVGDQRVLAVLGGAGDPAGHPGVVESADGVGRVAGLQVGERRAVGDDVLQGLDVGVVDRRVVDVGQHAVRDGEPHLRRGVAGGAETVLAGQVEVGQRTRTAGGGASGARSTRWSERDQQCGGRGHRGDQNRGGPCAHGGACFPNAGKTERPRSPRAESRRPRGGCQTPPNAASPSCTPACRRGLSWPGRP